MDKYNVINAHRHGLYDVPDHEVLISFNNDDDAYLFVEWFEKNSESFQSFVDERQGG